MVQAPGEQAQHVERSVAKHEPHARPRACEACRSRKIKCSGAPENSEGVSCASCDKYQRVCVFREGPPPKRRKRVDVRVRELEQQINRLSAQLMRPHLPFGSLEDEPDKASSIPLTAAVDRPAGAVDNDAQKQVPSDMVSAQNLERSMARSNPQCQTDERCERKCQQCKARKLKVSRARKPNPRD
jgi:hypothetical protein